MKKICLLFFTLCFSILAYANAYCMTFDEFISDSRFKNGALWSWDKHARDAIYSRWTGQGCFAYCQEFVYECWGHDYYKPQLGIKYDSKDYKTEVCAGDVIHKRWGNGDNDQHWFAVLARDGNKLYVAEGNVTINGGEYVRVSWRNDLYLSSSDWVVDCYHAPQFNVENKETVQKSEQNNNNNVVIYGSNDDNDGTWTEWQDEAISNSNGAEVQTRKVPSSYIMVTFVCGVSGYPRGYYSWNKGSFRCDYTFEWTASEFDNAIVYHEGDYFDFPGGSNCDGLIGGGGNAYVKDSDWYIPCYVRETKYKTQYRSKKNLETNVNENADNKTKDNNEDISSEQSNEDKTENKTSNGNSSYDILNGNFINNSSYDILNGNSIGNGTSFIQNLFDKIFGKK